MSIGFEGSFCDSDGRSLFASPPRRRSVAFRGAAFPSARGSKPKRVAPRCHSTHTRSHTHNPQAKHLKHPKATQTKATSRLALSSPLLSSLLLRDAPLRPIRPFVSACKRARPQARLGRSYRAGRSGAPSPLATHVSPSLSLSIGSATGTPTRRERPSAVRRSPPLFFPLLLT
jgi:hypothetical protein